jgi:hypothetical protein
VARWLSRKYSYMSNTSQLMRLPSFFGVFSLRWEMRKEANKNGAKGMHCTNVTHTAYANACSMAYCAPSTLQSSSPHLRLQQCFDI